MQKITQTFVTVGVVRIQARHVDVGDIWLRVVQQPDRTTQVYDYEVVDAEFDQDPNTPPSVKILFKDEEVKWWTFAATEMISVVRTIVTAN